MIKLTNFASTGLIKLKIGQMNFSGDNTQKYQLSSFKGSKDIDICIYPESETEICRERGSIKLSRLSKKISDCLYLFQIVWKSSRLSRTFPDCLNFLYCQENFQIVWKLSRLTGNFPDFLKVSWLSVNFPDCLESFRLSIKFPACL